MRTDIERFFCAPPSGNCCNAEIRRRVCGCVFPRQTPSSGTAGISLTKHRINAILIHGRRARYVRFCRSGFSAAQSGKRSGAGLRRDVEAAFLTRPAIKQFLDKMVCNRFVICGICRKLILYGTFHRTLPGASFACANDGGKYFQHFPPI